MIGDIARKRSHSNSVLEKANLMIWNAHKF